MAGADYLPTVLVAAAKMDCSKFPPGIASTAVIFSTQR